MTLRLAAATHVGSIRQRNEDCFGFTGGRAVQEDDYSIELIADGSPFLAAISDGLGGHPCGDRASRTVVAELLRRAPSDPASLVAAIESADAALRGEGDTAPECDGLAATVAAVLVGDDGYVVANVGDSRVYVLEDSLPLTLLSTDDVLGNADVLRLSPGPVTRVLGGPHKAGAVDPHLFGAARKSRTRIMMCSDGLSSYVPNADIASILRTRDGLRAVNALVERSLAAGGRDNVTVLLAEFD